ncbi:DUF1523 family protein [Albirhodobacter sp. R86504]|jgi:hypothetical protein|uniref:DUF1523 family protein n=1 Tax=Albirhodobacter sp. R86504 TaxID=3093848 RepID=UPI00366C5DDA
MKYVKWTFLSLIAILLLSFFHYTLPQHDVVRIVGTENRRIDFGENSFFWAQADVGTSANTNRDVFFIQSVQPNGKPMVYRNEDTGWGWPPYFKLNSSNLQAQAQSMVSNAANPQWVMVTHYGWRNEWFTIFPNAVGLKEVESPDATVVPWVNITILITLLLLVLTIRAIFLQFKQRSIDPVFDDIGEAWDDVEEGAGSAGKKAKGLWGRLTGKR